MTNNKSIQNEEIPSETKMEIISIDENLSIHFIYVPHGYAISKLTMEKHVTQVIGRLKHLNRVKILKSWKKDNGDLVKAFTEILKSRGWDFDKFPDPVAYASYLTNE